MTLEGLKRVHPRDEDNDEDRNNDNENYNPADTIKNNNDSSRYHYQPPKKQRDTIKTEAKVSVSPAHKTTDGSINIHDVALTVIGRATI